MRNRVGTPKFFMDVMLLARAWGEIETESPEGFFYLNPSKNCGNLGLVNFQYARTGLGNYLYNENTISIEPKKNKLILFNAPTYHFVDKNFSDKIRISISFNSYILKEQ